MTDRELILKKVAANCRDDMLSTDSLNNMGVKDLLHLMRLYNASRNRGELNDQFIEWIINNECKYSIKIADVFKLGTRKVQFTYYGMIYTIIKWEGCYIRGRGKCNAPNEISYSEYCESLLKLNKRFQSKNVRKTLKLNYSHNYYIDIACDENGDIIKQYPEFQKLKPVFKEIQNEIKQKGFV